MRRKTLDEFKKEVFDLVGEEYTILSEEYKNAKTKIEFQHNSPSCNNHRYLVAPDKFLNGNRCPKCFGTHLKTTEEFKKEVFDLVGDEYSVLGDYIKASTKILIRHHCSKCENHEYSVTPNDFLNGYRCPICAGNKKLTLEKLQEKFFSLVGNEYTILSKEYKNAKTRITIQHNVCSHTYEVTPNNFLRGRRCPKCAKKKQK